MIAASHNANGWTRAGAGEPLLCGGMGKPASVISHDQSQMGRSTRLRNSSMRGHFHSTAPTCRGLHCATAFSILRCARLSPRVAAPRRHVCILPNGRAATHSYAARGGLHRSRSFAASGFVPIRRCALARGPQFCLPEHSTRQSSDALEGHFSTSLSGLSFQHRNDDTPERPKSWKRQPTRTAP
jgi:hypothetical protein